MLASAGCSGSHAKLVGNGRTAMPYRCSADACWGNMLRIGTPPTAAAMTAKLEKRESIQISEHMDRAKKSMKGCFPPICCGTTAKMPERRPSRSPMQYAAGVGVDGETQRAGVGERLGHCLQACPLLRVW